MSKNYDELQTRQVFDLDIERILEAHQLIPGARQPSADSAVEVKAPDGRTVIVLWNSSGIVGIFRPDGTIPDVRDDGDLIDFVRRDNDPTAL